MSALLKRFGLRMALKRKAALEGKKAGKKHVQELIQKYTAETKDVLNGYFKDQQLVLRSLFARNNTLSDDDLPIHLEIASGRGDFALAHALHGKSQIARSNFR